MNRVELLISFNLWTFEFQINKDFIIRKVIPRLPEFYIPNDELLILDQKQGKIYTVHEEDSTLSESPFLLKETGWQSDQYEITHIELRPITDGPWTGIDIIESIKPTSSNQIEADGLSRKITRVCQVPELENLLMREEYHRFLTFYRTDINIPFHGLVTKQWMEYPDAADMDGNEYILSQLTSITENPENWWPYDHFLTWPVRPHSPK